MYVSILAILIPLSLAPAMTWKIFCDVARQERSQIAVDNAAIVLGRADRDLFMDLSASNRILKQLDRIHHPLHVCARAASPGAMCVGHDLAIEREIMLMHQTIGKTAEARWRSNLRVALMELEKLKIPLVSVSRKTFPVHPKRCPVCGLNSAWEINVEQRPFVTHFSAGSPACLAVVRLEGICLTDNSRWNYRLEATP